MEAPHSTIIFASGDLLVRLVGGFSDAICFVTFQSYTDERILDRPGFGEDYFRHRDIDAIHIISRDNDWYQYPEWPDALAKVATVTAAYGKVISYGSSMGGFAALRYGAACGAQLGIGISPQYSIDPAIAPFEARWAADAERIRFRDDNPAPLPLQYILFDPRDPWDRRHFELFAAASPTIGVRATYGGHPAGAFASEAGLLSDLLGQMVAGTFDTAAFEAELRKRRRLSGQYLFNLSRQVPTHRPYQRIRLARMAVDATPGCGPYESRLGSLLTETGALAEAEEWHRCAIDNSAGNVHIAHAYMRHLGIKGEFARALELADKLISAHPGLGPLRSSRIDLLLAQHDLDARYRRAAVIAQDLRELGFPALARCFLSATGLCQNLHHIFGGQARSPTDRGQPMQIRTGSG